MHDVVVQQGARLLTQAGFSIDMTMKLLADSGPLEHFLGVTAR